MLSGAFLVVEGATQRDAHHEPLGAVVQVVDVHDRHLRLPLDAMAFRVRHVAADQVFQVPHRAEEASHERVDGALADGTARPVGRGCFVLHMLRHEVREGAESPDLRALQDHAAVS